MNTIIRIHLVAAALALAAGCSTTATFKIPEKSFLYIHDRPEPVVIAPDGTVTSNPFFWTAAPGVKYRLEKDGKVIKEGRIPSAFRPASIFWPPLALIYWPIGFDYNIVNDLTVK